MASLSSSIIVLIVIIAAAASVVVGFATQRLFGKADPAADNFNHKKPEQVAYMREVRERNMMEAFGDRRPPPPHGHEI
jgi:flagellar basal body-associated protein FliL